MRRNALVFKARFAALSGGGHGARRGFTQFLGSLHHRLRAPCEAVDAAHPAALLPRLIFVERRVDPAQHRFQGDARFAPCLNQRPVERREQQQRSTALLESLFDLGKVVEIVGQDLPSVNRP